jgi:hypothetical protein
MVLDVKLGQRWHYGSLTHRCYRPAGLSFAVSAVGSDVIAQHQFGRIGL